MNTTQWQNLKLEIMPEKCKHIPALDFKNMCTAMYNLVTQKDKILTEEHVEMPRRSSERLLHHKIVWKIDSDRITMSMFSLLPNVDFEFYRVKPFPLHWTDSFSKLLEESQSNGKISIFKYLIYLAIIDRFIERNCQEIINTGYLIVNSSKNFL